NQIFEKLLSHLHVFVALTNLPGGTKSSFCAGSRPPRFFLSAGLWKYFVALWRLLFPTCGRDDRFTLALTPLCGLGEQKDYLTRLLFHKWERNRNSHRPLVGEGTGRGEVQE
ncbi:MAG: hypothetical protein LBB65_08620, partial [Burkholderiales bacterium]|nr:hypothetical protein [Burkholderiales bacterium]